MKSLVGFSSTFLFEVPFKRYRALSKHFCKRLLSSSCLSVRPSFRMEQLGFQRKVFHETVRRGFPTAIRREISNIVTNCDNMFYETPLTFITTFYYVVPTVAFDSYR